MTDPNMYPSSDTEKDRVLDAVAESAMKRRAERRKREVRESEITQKIEKGQLERAKFIEDFCRPAEVIDYAYWLQGYIKNGGKITHHYDFDLPEDDFFVLQVYQVQRELAEKGTLRIPVLRGGAHAIHLIIPESIDKKALVSDLESHNELYYMEGFNLDEDKHPLVGSYVDVEQEMLTLVGLPE